MTNPKENTHVEILGKRYSVACPESQVDALHQAAHHLDKKMRQIRDSKKVFGLDRIAVMAALNITHELLTQQHNSLDYKHELENRMRHLNEKLDEVIITSPLEVQVNEDD